MKKIALMMTTLFALTNIVIPSTATYALEQIRIVESFDECDNLNEFNTSNKKKIYQKIMLKIKKISLRKMSKIV